MPIWSGGRAQLLLALKYDVGPMGPRVTLDPDKLIATDTQAMIDYLASQLASHYAALTSVAVKWAAVTRANCKTIETAYQTYLSQRNAKKTQKDSSDTVHSDAKNDSA